jgi:hypothetical protein
MRMEGKIPTKLRIKRAKENQFDLRELDLKENT